MSKKQQRVKYLIGIYNVLRKPKIGVEPGYEYDEKEMQQVIETVKHLLAEDGIRAMSADSPVETKNA
ncbi:hypothetical protein [Endozoicomonas acroporae]|uniref:hypothetical protein n=1 Tax=Endozoicomonas TaxID=305899 RepID=UPI0013D1424E|nr:hypothetical protein [Endozoicomonas acroporae]